MAAAITATVSAPHDARAQAAVSAADKATARMTATEGIQLYRDQKYAEALDRFNRAQQLYDAPVHLVYIARCQRQLGSLVEAAETYRTLTKTSLEANAPDAFVKAVEDGKQELAELEPQIPEMVIRVAPADAPNLKLTLDGQEVPPAVVGIKRPLNPGRRTLRVTAEGFEAEERVIDVKEGQPVEVAVNLKPSSKQEVATTDPIPQEEVTDGSATEQHESQSPLSSVALLLGARLGVAVPTGKVPGAAAHPRLDGEVRLKELAKVGGEAELRVGAHFFDRWGVIGFLSFQGLNDQTSTFEGQTDTATPITTTSDPGAPSIGTVGFAILGGTPRGQFGGFAELGFGILRRMSATTEGSGTGPAGLTCEANMSASGSALRLSAGLNIPLRRRLLHLTPYATAQFGGVNRVEYTTSDDCPDFLSDTSISTDGADYATISFGVGGEFFIGGND